MPQDDFASGTGMPAPESIIEERSFAPVRRRLLTTEAAAAALAERPKYRMLVTNEVDEYEQGATAVGTLDEAFAARAAAPRGDRFKGHARKAAKLSIAGAKVEEFGDLKELVESLTADSKMVKHKPKIEDDEDSGRVQEEQRNVRVRAFLYAHSREDDNDFHLIIGRDPKLRPEMYMTVEVSGLPAKTSPFFNVLKGARDSYKEFFDDMLPGARYVFPRPPIPVLIEGSLFFDITHAHGGRPGPGTLRPHMPTIWEVHPVTTIVLEP